MTISSPTTFPCPCSRLSLRPQRFDLSRSTDASMAIVEDQRFLQDLLPQESRLEPPQDEERQGIPAAAGQGEAPWRWRRRRPGAGLLWKARFEVSVGLLLWPASDHDLLLLLPRLWRYVLCSFMILVYFSYVWFWRLQSWILWLICRFICYRTLHLYDVFGNVSVKWLEIIRELGVVKKFEDCYSWWEGLILWWYSKKCNS